MKILESGATRLGITLNSIQLEQFQIYYRELSEWNQRVNLTSITDYTRVQTLHFLDSLTLALAIKHPVNEHNFSIIDIGSGAGLPGIPLKILYPEAGLALLDSTSKKTAFLRHLVEMLKLDGVEIINGRAETIAHEDNHREKYDMVLSRAVAGLPTLTELCLPFCAVGGIFIAQKKGNIEEEINQAAHAISLLGGNLREVKDIELEEFTDHRQLVIIDKVSATPPQYPRRPGIPTKRPLLPPR